MEVVRPDDASSFLRLAGPLLERDEARHNLILGIAGTLLRHPEVFPVHHLWVVLDAGLPVAAALQTEPYNLVLADPATEDALDALLLAVRDDGSPIPGVIANVPHAADAARQWAALTGTEPRIRVSEGVWELTRVREVPRPPGATRAATDVDRERLLDWNRAFLDEALPAPAMELDRVEEMVDRSLSREDAGTWFWQVDGEPVSLAGFGGETPTGIRVGPVYTPMRHRRRGYATALVAELSRFLLDAGRRACFLYTDLANPTSNAIYSRIGYARVCDAADIRFHDP
jgi:predicted GNAT family acetyltransferase